jgi:hypothetical protein
VITLTLPFYDTKNDLYAIRFAFINLETLDRHIFSWRISKVWFSGFASVSDWILGCDLGLWRWEIKDILQPSLPSSNFWEQVIASISSQFCLCYRLAGLKRDGLTQLGIPKEFVSYFLRKIKAKKKEPYEPLSYDLNRFSSSLFQSFFTLLFALYFFSRSISLLELFQPIFSMTRWNSSRSWISPPIS